MTAATPSEAADAISGVAPIVPWPGWPGETCLRTPASTPREAVARVQGAQDVRGENWLVTPHLGGWFVALDDEPIPAGGGAWLVTADGEVRHYSQPADGFLPAAARSTRVRVRVRR
jgi:hypothetical protein